MKVALHACCGPCLIEPVDALTGAHDVTVVFANPNIRPADEYVRRRDTLREWAVSRALDMVEVPYDPGAWEEAAGGMRDDRASRCPRCYALRLRQAAAEGASLGCDALATTLSVSPYQDPDAIDEAGREASIEHGLVWLFEDFRPRYPEATRRAREEGMYRQDYCGCLASKAQAEERRARRRADRVRG